MFVSDNTLFDFSFYLWLLERTWFCFQKQSFLNVFIFCSLQGLISTGRSFPNNNNVRTVQVQLESPPSNYSQIKVNRNLPPPPPPAAPSAAPPGLPGGPPAHPAPSYDFYMQQGQRAAPHPPVAPRHSAQVNRNKIKIILLLQIMTLK